MTREKFAIFLKTLRDAKDFANDNGRLAQWLRAIDTLNRNADFSEFASDPIFKVLQEEGKWCNFSARYLMTEDPVISNEAMAVYYKQEKIATNLLKAGDSVEIVARNTMLPLSFVNEIKKALDQGMLE